MKTILFAALTLLSLAAFSQETVKNDTLQNPKVNQVYRHHSKAGTIMDILIWDVYRDSVKLQLPSGTILTRSLAYFRENKMGYQLIK